MRRSNDNRNYTPPISIGACFDRQGRFGFIVPNRIYLREEQKTLAQILSCLAGGYDCDDLSEVAADTFTGQDHSGRALFVFIRGWAVASNGDDCPTFGVVPLDEV